MNLQPKQSFKIDVEFSFFKYTFYGFEKWLPRWFIAVRCPRIKETKNLCAKFHQLGSFVFLYCEKECRSFLFLEVQTFFCLFLVAAPIDRFTCFNKCFFFGVTNRMSSFSFTPDFYLLILHNRKRAAPTMGNEILEMNFVVFSVSVQWILATEIALQQNKKALIMAKCSSIGFIISPCHISLALSLEKWFKVLVVQQWMRRFGMWSSQFSQSESGDTS